MLHPLAFQMPGFGEWIVIAAIGLLLFGKRLPEVGRSVGKTIVEFKKGMKEVENEAEQQASLPPPAAKPALPGEYKFDPYTGKPLEMRFDPYTGKPLNAERESTSTPPTRETT